MNELETAPALETAAPPLAATPRQSRKGLATVVALVAAGLLLYFLLKPSSGAVRAGVSVTPTVAVEPVTRQTVYNQVPIPAEFRPYLQAELHAMVTGYVSKMNVDFGDKVKKGEVLATIEVPELYEELRNAQAREQQAEADYANAHQIYSRLLEVNQQHPKLVAQQDIDTAKSKDESSAAEIGEAKAEIEKYNTQIGYTNIIAPFDGIITQRSADPGALVQAGTSSGGAMPLVRVSDDYLLRLDFPVSVDYVKFVRVGDPISVRVDSLGGKIFTGKITRFTNHVDDETRTMETEMEVENPDLEIVPGMYAAVLFKYEEHANALTIPTEALSDPKNPDVYVVDANHTIQSRPVRLGIEMPNRFEVIEGVHEGDLVMIGSRAGIQPGERVETKVVSEPALPPSPSM